MNEHDDIMHMAIDHRWHEEEKRRNEQGIIDELMRMKGKEFEKALTDAVIYGTGVVGAQTPQVSYSMAEIQLMDGSSQTFMIKASTNIVSHLIKEMKEKGYLTMWNDTDVLSIRADQVRQFTLRAFTQEEK